MKSSVWTWNLLLWTYKCLYPVFHHASNFSSIMVDVFCLYMSSRETTYQVCLNLLLEIIFLVFHFPYHHVFHQCDPKFHILVLYDSPPEQCQTSVHPRNSFRFILLPHELFYLSHLWFISHYHFSQYLHIILHHQCHLSCIWTL